MPRIELRAALKALAGFVAGLVLWIAFTPQYDRMIARGAEMTLRAFEKPAVTRLKKIDDKFTSVDREDFDPRSKRPGIQLRDLTFNFILLCALFAIHPRAISDRNILGFVLASLALALTHVIATVAEVMSIYVAKLGPWSRVHYSDLERNIWGVASHGYRMVLMYAIAFGLWYVFRAPAEAVREKPRREKKATSRR
ncbi:MAG TPA: hypothetical protein VGF48_03130 [Thermoanaerobaculia bacterium]